MTDQAAAVEAPKEELTLERDGHIVFAVVELDGVKVKERIPLHVMKWDEERMTWYITAVARRLKEKFRREKANPRRKIARPA